MFETGVVISLEGDAIFWHLPPGRDSVRLPDSRELWTVIWENRERIAGIAHTHLGRGLPQPSSTDLTTFAAIEDGLGRRLTWWIFSETHAISILHVDLLQSPHHFTQRYLWFEYKGRPAWLKELRAKSYGKE